MDGVYDPCRRLLLGMKGSISEFELGIRARMLDAARALTPWHFNGGTSLGWAGSPPAHAGGLRAGGYRCPRAECTVSMEVGASWSGPGLKASCEIEDGPFPLSASNSCPFSVLIYELAPSGRSRGLSSEDRRSFHKASTPFLPLVLGRFSKAHPWSPAIFVNELDTGCF
jgi:hypothetical protein